MELNPKDVRVTHYYHGSGKGSAFEATHLPTGVAVSEEVAAGSTENGSRITKRLLSKLKAKIETEISRTD